MANYVKSTNFTAKDGLPAGNSGKIVKGAEIDAEFTAIASAISSKADTNSPTFTGTPLAPTASEGTSSTQIATTAFVAVATTAERTASATLTNKTLTDPVISAISNSGTITLPTGNRTLVARDTTDTLTNKSVALGSNTVTGTKAQFNTAVTDTDFVFLNDFTGANQSLNSSGYQKLPGGLIIQWVYTTPSSANQNISFPISFPTACLIVLASLAGNNYTNYFAPNVVSWSTSGFVHGGSYTTFSQAYIAIGY